MRGVDGNIIPEALAWGCTGRERMHQSEFDYRHAGCLVGCAARGLDQRLLRFGESCSFVPLAENHEHRAELPSVIMNFSSRADPEKKLTQ